MFRRRLASMELLPRRCALQILQLYKRLLSPLFPPACRYVPTCSEYAMEAVDRYGVLRGGLMAAARLLRCHPFVRGGFDPVPLPRCEIHETAEFGAQQSR